MSKAHFTSLTSCTHGSIEELQALLDKVGVKMVVSEDPRDPSYSSIDFEFDAAAIDRRYITRRAGRKKRDAFNRMTLAEYRERVANGETLEQIASYVSLSRSTLYRRVKAAELQPGDDDNLKIVVE